MRSNQSRLQPKTVEGGAGMNNSFYMVFRESNQGLLVEEQSIWGDEGGLVLVVMLWVFG